MSNEPKVSMLREILFGLNRMVEVIVEGISLPAHVMRFFRQRYGSRRLYWLVAGFIGLAVIVVSAPSETPKILTLRFWEIYEKQLKTISEVVRNFGLLLAGLVGLGFGVWRAYTAFRQTQIAQDQARITEQGQITDRYSEAVKMLSSAIVRTRVGAVFALARIARDSVKRDHNAVMEVLTEFIRNPPYVKEADARAKERIAETNTVHRASTQDDIPTISPAIPCPDVHAALKVISDKNYLQIAREADG